MEKVRFGSDSRSRSTSVDLPEPEGPEMMKTEIMGGGKSTLSFSFQVKRLFADFFDAGFGCQGQVGYAQAQFAEAGALGQNCVGFAVHFLQQEIQLFAGFAARVEDLIHLAGVDLQTRNLFADIAAVSQQGGFLSDPL